MQNSLLSLTASVTLREEVIDVGQAGTSVDTASMRTETETLRTNGTEYEERDDGEDDEVAEMEEIDLLGGLAGGTLNQEGIHCADNCISRNDASDSPGPVYEA